MATTTKTKRSIGYSKAAYLTPLGTIATFVALSETVAGLAAVKTSGTVQMVFAIFSVIFPVFVAGLFFSVLWRRAYVFYPPKEFGRDVDVTKYVEAMRHQAIGNQELISLVRTSVSETLRSQDAQVALAKASSEGLAINSLALMKATAEIADKAVYRIEESVVRVDISEFESSTFQPVPELIFPYDPQQDAFALLSAVYYQISFRVPAFTYGKTWVLRDQGSNNLILPSHIDWRDNFALANSGATIEQFGFRAGMRLRAEHIS